MHSFRLLLVLLLALAFAKVGRATETIIDFQVHSIVVAGTNTMSFASGGSGYLGATYSLYGSSSNLIATTLASTSDVGFAGFGPASDIVAYGNSGAVVNNIGTLFPASSAGSLVIQSLGPITFGNTFPYPYIDFSALTNGGGSGFLATITSITTQASPTPEPASIMLFGTGLLSILILLRKGVLA